MRISRRHSLLLGASSVAAGLAPGGLRAAVPVADAVAPTLAIEPGASLRVLRPTKFVDGDERVFKANSASFTEKTGVPVRVDMEGWEDLRPKTAVAANVGSGPDIVLAWSDDPHKFADKCLDVTELAEYLGKKYGGWWPIAEKYGKTTDGHWIAMPIGGSGSKVVYRKSWVNEAGYAEIPKDVDGFLDLSRKLKANGHPIGFALGNAVGDANSWCHWALWAFGGAMTDEQDKVILDSPATLEAVRYAKALYDTFIPGTLSWLDPSNNKAMLAGEIAFTANGISVYYAAKNSPDEKVKALAEDIYHANMPIGPVGRPTERALIINQMIFQHTKYPNAAKAYLLHMMEQEQYEAWLTGSIGYWNHPLKAYDAAAIWSEDPKHEPYKRVLADAVWDGYQGSVGEASAAVLSDFVVVQMISAVCAGQATPEEAVAEAARRAKRYYRS